MVTVGMPGRCRGGQAGHRGAVEAAAQEGAGRRSRLERARDGCRRRVDATRAAASASAAARLVVEIAAASSGRRRVAAVPVQPWPPRASRCLEDAVRARDHVEVDVSIQGLRPDRPAPVPDSRAELGGWEATLKFASACPEHLTQADRRHDDGATRPAGPAARRARRRLSAMQRGRGQPSDESLGKLSAAVCSWSGPSTSGRGRAIGDVPRLHPGRSRSAEPCAIRRSGQTPETE